MGSGNVGVGVGKARDIASTIKKGKRDARRKLVQVPLTKSKSIPHPVTGEFDAANLILRPSAPGSGVIAGSSIRSVLEVAGVRNILSKRLGSSNLLNNAKATMEALKKLRSYRSVKEKPGDYPWLIEKKQEQKKAKKGKSNGGTKKNKNSEKTKEN